MENVKLCMQMGAFTRVTCLTMRCISMEGWFTQTGSAMKENSKIIKPMDRAPTIQGTGLYTKETGKTISKMEKETSLYLIKGFFKALL